MKGLRDLRRSRGLTLEAVGYMARIDQATVSRIERGLVKPLPETVVRLARAYGISIRRFERLLAASPTTNGAGAPTDPGKEGHHERTDTRGPLPAA